MRRRELVISSAAFAALACGSAAARSKDLRLLTSYDAEVIEPFVAAFQERHPSVALRHLNKNTPAAVQELVAGYSREFDLFWASSPEAFEVLKTSGRLRDVGYGLHPDFAYSAVGWAWRSPLDRAVPQEWNDLLDPMHAGRIVMSHPMRSGTTHSLIETVLQDRGWEAGWSWLLELAGQLYTIAARSFGVLQGLGDRYDLGLTIDFLALKRASEGLVFRYGRPVIISPARIAALKGGANSEAAAAFIAFLLSHEGQRLLLRPDIRRIPANSEIRAELADSLLPEVRAALRFSWSRYDPELASRRYDAVNALFEAFIGRDFLHRRDLWRRWRGLAGSQTREHAMVRGLLTHMPVSEASLRMLEQNRATLLDWQAQSRRLLASAEARLMQLESRR
jgi:ABC-type Fe3+ transport system substrate-binding protein